MDATAFSGVVRGNAVQRRRDVQYPNKLSTGNGVCTFMLIFRPQVIFFLTFIYLTIVSLNK